MVYNRLHRVKNSSGFFYLTGYLKQSTHWQEVFNDTEEY